MDPRAGRDAMEVLPHAKNETLNFHGIQVIGLSLCRDIPAVIYVISFSKYLILIYRDCVVIADTIRSK